MPAMITAEQIRKILEHVKDPEIPVLTVDDLGIIRDVDVDENGRVTVTITPTYSGCPAMNMIELEIKATLHEHGIEKPVVKTVLSPPWTTAWISEEGRKKLKAFGIAPPADEVAGRGVLFGKEPEVICPFCDSKNTRQVSRFGSTPCKAQYACNDCAEPFDYFKCH